MEAAIAAQAAFKSVRTARGTLLPLMMIRGPQRQVKLWRPFRTPLAGAADECGAPGPVNSRA